MIFIFFLKNVNKLFPDDVLFSRRGRMGKILSPRHTLPPNTTCTYYFHGQPGDLIWISFTSYNLQILQHAIQDNNTLGRVNIPFFLLIKYYFKIKTMIAITIPISVD